MSTESASVDNVSTGPGPARMQVLCPPPQSLPPRIERRRENEKKFSKQKGISMKIYFFCAKASGFLPIFVLHEESSYTLRLERLLVVFIVTVNRTFRSVSLMWTNYFIAHMNGPIAKSINSTIYYYFFNFRAETLY